MKTTNLNFLKSHLKSWFGLKLQIIPQYGNTSRNLKYNFHYNCIVSRYILIRINGESVTVRISLSLFSFPCLFTWRRWAQLWRGCRIQANPCSGPPNTLEVSILKSIILPYKTFDALKPHLWPLTDQPSIYSYSQIYLEIDLSVNT